MILRTMTLVLHCRPMDRKGRALALRRFLYHVQGGRRRPELPTHRNRAALEDRTSRRCGMAQVAAC